MTGVIDVGDPFELTYTSIEGSTVLLDWLDPNLEPVIDQQLVTPDAQDATKYPVTLVPTSAGMWTARFFDGGAVEDYYVRATSTIGQPPPLAAIGDVSVQFGELSDDEEDLAGYLLKAASKMVRQRFPLLDSQIVAGKLDQDVIAVTVAGMVLRVLRNPEGLRAETTGPFSRTYDTSAAAGLLAITTDDAQQLVPPVASSRHVRYPAAGSIRAVPGMLPPPPRVSGWPYGPR